MGRQPAGKTFRVSVKSGSDSDVPSTVNLGERAVDELRWPAHCFHCGSPAGEPPGVTCELEIKGAKPAPLALCAECAEEWNKGAVMKAVGEIMIALALAGPLVSVEAFQNHIQGAAASFLLGAFLSWIGNRRGKDARKRILPSVRIETTGDELTVWFAKESIFYEFIQANAWKCTSAAASARSEFVPLDGGGRWPITNKCMRTLDAAVVIYRECDLNSPIVASPPQGTEIQLGAASVIDGREWVEVTLLGGDRGYALAPNVRGHCT